MNNWSMSNTAVRSLTRGTSPNSRSDSDAAVDRIIFHMNAKLRRLEARYLDFVKHSQDQLIRAKVEERFSSSKDSGFHDDSEEQKQLQEIEKEKDGIDTEIQRILRGKKAQMTELMEGKEDRSAQAAYGAISEALRVAQTDILRLFRQSDFQVKSKVTNVFMGLSDALWEQVYRLKKQGDSLDMRELVNEILKLEQDKQVLDLKAGEAAETIRQRWNASKRKDAQLIALLQTENRHLEARFREFQSISNISSPSARQSACSPFKPSETVQRPSNLRTTAHSARSSNSPLWKRKMQLQSDELVTTEESFRDSHLEEMRLEVEKLRAQLAVSLQERNKPQPAPYVHDPEEDSSDLKRRLTHLTAEAKRYVKASQALVRNSQMQEAQDSLKSLTRAINDILLDSGLVERGRNWNSGRGGYSRYGLEPAYAMLESENVRLEGSLAVEKERSDRLYSALESLQNSPHPTSELRRLREKTMELERILDSEKALNTKLKLDHKSAIEELIKDCQELTEETKSLRVAKMETAEFAGKREAELKQEIAILETAKTSLETKVDAWKSKTTTAMEELSKKLMTDYKTIETRVESVDSRIAKTDLFLKENLKEVLAHLQSTQRKESEESRAATEREDMVYAAQQAQDWVESKLEEVRTLLENAERKNADLSLNLQREKELSGKLAMKVESLQALEPQAAISQLLSNQLETATHNLAVTEDRIKILLFETDQLKYEKTVLEDQNAHLIERDKRLSQDIQELTEQLQIFALKSEPKTVSPSFEQKEMELNMEEISEKPEIALESDLGSAQEPGEVGSLNQSEVLKLTETVQNLEEEKLRLETTVSALRKTIENELNPKISGLEKKCEELDAQKQEAERAYKETAVQHASIIIEERTELENQVRELQAKCGDMMDEIIRLKEPPPEPSPRDEKYKVQVKGADEAPADHSNLESELQRSREELNDMAKQKETLEREVERMQSSYLKMKGDRVHYETEMIRTKSLASISDMLKQQIESLNAEVKNLKEENQRLALASKPHLASELEDYEERIANFRSQLEARIRLNDDLDKKLSSQSAEMARQKDLYESKIRILSLSLEESAKEKQGLVDSIKEKTAEIARIQALFSAAESHSRAVEDDLVQVKQTLEDAYEQLQARTQEWTLVNDWVIELRSVSAGFGINAKTQDSVFSGLRKVLEEWKLAQERFSSVFGTEDLTNGLEAMTTALQRQESNERNPQVLDAGKVALETELLSKKKECEDLLLKYRDIFSDWKQAFSDNRQLKIDLEAEKQNSEHRLEANETELSVKKKELAQLEDDYFRLKQQHSQELAKLREDMEQKIANKDQYISDLVRNRHKEEDNFQPPANELESPHFELSAEGLVEIEQSSGEARDSFEEEVQEIMLGAGEPGIIVKTVEYEGTIWNLMYTNNKDYEWVKTEGSEKPVRAEMADLVRIQELLRPLVPVERNLADAVEVLTKELTMRRTASRTENRETPGGMHIRMSSRGKDASPSLEGQLMLLDRGKDYPGLMTKANPVEGEINSFERGEGKLGLSAPNSFGITSREQETPRLEMPDSPSPDPLYSELRLREDQMHRDAERICSLQETLQLLNSELAEERNTVSRLEMQIKILKEELHTKGNSGLASAESLAGHVKSALVALAAELPKQSKRVEEMLQTIYSHLGLSQRQVGMLDQARKAGKTEKAALVQQIWSN